MQQTKQRIKKRGYKYILVSVFVLLWGILGVYNTSFAFSNITIPPPSLGQTQFSSNIDNFYAGIFYPSELTESVSAINLLLQQNNTLDGRTYYLEIYEDATISPSVSRGDLIATSAGILDSNIGDYQTSPYITTFNFSNDFTFTSGKNYVIFIRFSNATATYNQADNWLTDSISFNYSSLHRFYFDGSNDVYDSDRTVFFSTVEGNFVADDFTITATLPDTTPINSGYDYIGNDFNNIGISLDGTNSLGLYDTFRIKTYKDGILVGTTYEIPINVSCITCNLGSFIMGDLGIDFTQYSEYLFNISMDSILADSIPKEFIISYDLIGNQVIYEDCTTVDLFCYIKNAFRWAFFIPPSTFDKFTGLKDTLSMKAPFGYISAILDELGNINNDTGNEVFVLEEVTPITDNIFSPIRTALMWLLYFTFAFMLFNRFKDIQI